MSRQYNCLPSQILGIKDSYTAFCFNEACSYVRMMLDNGKKIIKKQELEKKEYSSFEEFYKQFE